ncbi:PaaI family thioesterase [Aspergillus homomorphus CBS 101889]|uniref:Thioesterase domain-containing protein n=1 Tax=Aspergillus homomorphus (strain CBS 101889) TaxID=1450537 RepID=A0A395HUD1_ASPHC|nr:hypothetical protein BO97DRAFT_471298 [Aspergillus homomorphus CBS 101889]RAL10995.1 hypothetical protein BO97DRAFT_471298 [Aspergillus homomorphus CBS 101889]
MLGHHRIWQARLSHLTSSSQLLARHVRTNRRALSITAQQSTPRSSRWPRRILYTAIFGGLGYYVGSVVDENLLACTTLDTAEDAAKLRAIHSGWHNYVPIVRELRANPDYVEAEVYGNFSEEEKAHRLTSGPLRGSRGVGFQRVFYNDKEKTAVNVVWLGNGLEGWPTMVHGGALGTIIDEHLGRVAIRNLPQRTGVTANLEVQYRRPIVSNEYYTFHATLDQERSTERKAFVKGEVRDCSGTVRAEASALFVVPKNYKLREDGERF